MTGPETFSRGARSSDRRYHRRWSAWPLVSQIQTRLPSSFNADASGPADPAFTPRGNKTDRTRDEARADVFDSIERPASNREGPAFRTQLGLMISPGRLARKTDFLAATLRPQTSRHPATLKPPLDDMSGKRPATLRRLGPAAAPIATSWAFNVILHYLQRALACRSGPV